MRRVNEVQLYAAEILHDYGLNARTREIFMHGYAEVDDEPGVDWRLAERFVKNLRYLESVGEDPILVHSITCGGDWSYGMAVYDAIKSSHCHVTILAYAHARSMSSIILQAGDRRILTPSADFLIHYGTLEQSGNALSVTAEVEWNKRHCDKLMLDIYTAAAYGSRKYAKWTKPRIRKHLDQQMRLKSEWYMTPTEAVDSGFADGILGEPPFEDLRSLHA